MRNVRNKIRTSCRLPRLANVAVLTRESPSEARVSSAFNTQLDGATRNCRGDGQYFT
jgi:hypothetical protein